MEERTWRRGQKQTYTDRPLTDEEREFAADWENYKKLFEIMRYYNRKPISKTVKSNGMRTSRSRKPTNQRMGEWFL